MAQRYDFFFNKILFAGFFSTTANFILLATRILFIVRSTNAPFSNHLKATLCQALIKTAEEVMPFSIIQLSIVTITEML